MSEASTAAPVATQTPASTSTTMAAPPPAPAAGVSSANVQSVNPGSWMTGFNEDQKGYVGLKGFTGPDAVLDAYRNLEKLRGVPEERLLKLPEKFYDEKGAMTLEGRAIFEKLGTPKDAKEYGFKVDGPNANPKLLETFTKACFDAGIPKGQAEKLFGSMTEFDKANFKDAADMAQSKFRDADSALRKEWGAAHEQNVNIAKEGMRRLEISTKEVDSISAVLGHDKTMKFLKKMGEAVGEAAFITGQSQAKVMEPATARAKIKELMADKSFYDKLTTGDVGAREQWDRLHQQAAAGAEVRL